MRLLWFCLPLGIACGPKDLVVAGVASVTNEATCALDLAVPTPREIALDTAASAALRVPLIVLDRVERATTADRMLIRLECDSRGFTPDVGAPLSLSESRPLCLDRRSDVDDSELGWIETSIEATELREGPTAVFFEAISETIATQLDGVFRAGVLAEECCDVPGTNCDGQSGTPACLQLTEILERQLSLHVLLGLRPFARFSGERTHSTGPNRIGERLPLRIRGRLHTTDGDAIEFTQPIGVCRSCGARTSSTSPTREPLIVSSCNGAILP